MKNALPVRTAPDGSQYEQDHTGTVNQVNPRPYRYDGDYIARTYGVIPQDKLDATAHIRLGYLLGSVPIQVKKVLDYGYGSGAFLRAAVKLRGATAYGFEVNGLPLPPEAHPCSDPMADSWDVVCFYDVLEHIADLSFLSRLRTAYIVVTVPWCPVQKKGWESFWDWKHRKPDEHVHHWDPHSLGKTLAEHGFNPLRATNVEDCGRPGETPNILTVVARRM